MNANVEKKDRKKTRAIVMDDKTWAEIKETADRIGCSTSALLRIMYKEYHTKLEKDGLRGLLN
jgi:hypothetical protein